MTDTTTYMYRTASVIHIIMCTIFIHGFSNQSSNTDPILDPEEHESKFVAEDDMLPLHAPPASYSPFGGKRQNSRLAAMHASASVH